MKFGFVKVGAYTPKVKVADVEENVKNIITGIKQAEEKKVELLVFPELCVTGYTCGDLFYSDVLLKNAEKGTEQIAEFTKGKRILVFVGLPFRKNGVIYNVAAAINNGKVIALIPKTFMPNYNEFYEKRYFKSPSDKVINVSFAKEEVPFGAKIILKENSNESFRVAAEICEDLWTPYPPSISHAVNGATIIANLSCSNETVGKSEYRRNLVSSQSGHAVCGYVYCDSGDGESTTDTVYAGHNLIAENGNVLNESELFDCGLITSDIDTEFLEFERSKLFNQNLPLSEYVTVGFSANNKDSELERTFASAPFVPYETDKRNLRAKLILSMQAAGLKKRLEHTNAKSSVIGLSGGLDSTLALLVAVTAYKELGKNLKEIIAVTMPCFGTTSRTLSNSIKLAKSLGVTLKKIDITKAVKVHLKDIKHDETTFDVTYENAQARERTQVLMDIANNNGGLVIGTGDLSEVALGWSTYNGDHMSMYAVNSSVPKTLVRHIVSYYAETSKGKLKAVLYDILDTPVSPELIPGKDGEISQKTENIVGPYELHDFFLYYFIRRGYSPSKIYYVAKKVFNGAYSDETILKWLKTFFRRFFSQQFKRSCIPDGVKVGSVALSPRGDWRMPSDASYALWLEELDNIEL